MLFIFLCGTNLSIPRLVLIKIVDINVVSNQRTLIYNVLIFVLLFVVLLFLVRVSLRVFIYKHWRNERVLLRSLKAVLSLPFRSCTLIKRTGLGWPLRKFTVLKVSSIRSISSRSFVPFNRFFRWSNVLSPSNDKRWTRLFGRLNFFCYGLNDRLFFLHFAVNNLRFAFYFCFWCYRLVFHLLFRCYGFGLFSNFLFIF